MTDFSDWLNNALGLSPDVQGKLLSSVIIIALLWALRFLTLAIILRRFHDVHLHYRWRKTTTYVAVLLGVLLVGRLWWEGFGSVATFLGLVSAGLAIALREPIVNLAGWAFILWRRPFEVGDRIQIGNHAGDVIDLRVFQFTLMEIGNWVQADQDTGRIIHVPNGKVFTEVQANYSKGFNYIWHEIPVLMTFESNWQKAKGILAQIALKHAEHLSKSAEEEIKAASRKYLIFYSNLAPTVYTTVRDSGVLLTIRYLCDPRKRRTTEQAIWEEILQEFSRHNDIDFAYPTQRFFDNAVESKTRVKNTRKPTKPRKGRH